MDEMLLRERRREAAIASYNALNGQEKVIFTRNAIEELLRHGAPLDMLMEGMPLFQAAVYESRLSVLKKEQRSISDE